jgi:hypothetical protein
MHKPGLAFQSSGRQILWCRLWCWIRGYLLSSFLLRHEDVLSINVGVSRRGGVPKPTSEVSPRAPAQMGRREAEREGGK